MSIISVCAGVYGGQKRALDTVETQAVVSLLKWVLGTKFSFSGRTTTALKHCTSSLAPIF